ncbi:hypothetical protein AYB33_16765 [Leptospira santarosai]|uniref:hypothetical protein n=1 Tax=Leptospira santarosai TaxID=28183 RepID=UPI0007785644|nr:hypothetical protein [Leptospira santarosai]KXZ30615.1 hypothetical protein AYB33_16765 [Leptospira santarosai]
MELVNRISFIGALLVALYTTNCLFSVKPTYKVDKLESDIKPKAEIWTPAGFKQNKQDVEEFFKILHTSVETIRYKETEVNKVQVYTYEKFEQTNEILGLIGIVNACILIPCRFSNEYSLTLQYVVDSDVKKEEEYRENKTLWVWIPLVFYNLFKSNSDRNEFLNSGFRRILADVGPNIANSVTQLEKENKNYLNAKAIKENSAWEKINKDSIKEIANYIKVTPPGDSRIRAELYLKKYLDKKVQLALAKKFPAMKSFLSYKIILSDGTDMGFEPFYSLFRKAILEKNPETGIKLDINLYQNGGKIVWEVQTDNEINLFYFFPHKTNLTLEKVLSRHGIVERQLHYQDGMILADHLFRINSAIPDTLLIDPDL